MLLHKRLQRRLRQLREPTAESAGYIIDTAYPYRPLPENEVWGADLAFFRAERETSASKWLMGSPELVIEVKSPSNSTRELQDKAMTALAGGAIEFWVLDGKKKIINVYSKAAGMRIYSEGTVPVPLFDCPISLKALFSE